MTTRKNKTDKGFEIWYKLLHNDDFKKELDKIKKDFSKASNKNDVSYYFIRDGIFRKFGVLPTLSLNDLFDEYALKTVLKNKRDHLPFRLQMPSEEELQKSKRAFVKLWIYDGVPQEEIYKYIGKNYKIIQGLLKTEGLPKVKRVRKIKDKEKVDLILELNKLSLSELKKKSGLGSLKIPREILIQHILEQNEHTLTSDVVKGIIYRLKPKKIV